MKKALAFLSAASFLALASCGGGSETSSAPRNRNATLATVPGTPPQIFLKIDTIDTTPWAPGPGTPKFVAKLRWSAPLSNGGAPVTGYEIQMRWNATEGPKGLLPTFKNWTSCADIEKSIPGDFIGCLAARTSTQTTAEISSVNYAKYDNKVISHVVQGMEYRVAAINSAGPGAYSNATQLTCKYGGACEFGDLGPGGGVVYNVPAATQTLGVYSQPAGNEIGGADWQYSGLHTWAAMGWAIKTNCPGTSCYSPAPPAACATGASSIYTCGSIYSWHLPFAAPLRDEGEWKPMCNKYAALHKTWGHLYGDGVDTGIFYWTGSAPIIPAGISINLSVGTILSVIAEPGPGVLVEMVNEAYQNWSTSSLDATTAMRFPCDFGTKAVPDTYTNHQLKRTDGSIYYDTSVRSSVNAKAAFSRPIRNFTMAKAALKPQTAPSLAAETGDGGVILKVTAGTPSSTLTSQLAKAQILPLNDYLIEYKKTTDTTWSTYRHTPSVNMITTVDNSALTAGVKYDFRVTESNTLGNGPVSNTSSATPGKFFQKALTVSTTDGTFPNTNLSSTGGDGTGAVTYSVTNGTASGCSVNGVTLTVTSVGTCKVTATKDADSTFLQAVSDAATITFAKSPQAALTVTSLSGPFDKPLTLTAAGGSGDGAVTFALWDTDTRFCSVTGNTLTYIYSIKQTFTCRVTATKATSTNYLAVSSELTTINLTQGSQAPIVFAAPDAVTVPSQKVTVSANGGSGTGTGTFSVRNGTGKKCVVSFQSESGGTFSAQVSINDFDSAPMSAGTCIVTAKRAGDNNFLESTPVEATVTFNKGTQATLSMAGGLIGPRTGMNLSTTGGTGTGAVTYSVVTSATNTLTPATNCRISGSQLLADTFGSCWVTATKAADDAYAATTSAKAEALVQRAEQTPLTLGVTPSTGPVGVGTPVTFALGGGSGTGLVTYTIKSGTAKNCTLVSGKVSAASIGTCIITATKAGDNSLYYEATVDATFTMAKGTQTNLTVNQVRGQALTPSADIALSTTGGSGTGAVTFTVNNAGTANCTVSGNKLTAAGAGTCSLSAAKAGDGDYEATTSASITVTYDVKIGDNGPSGGVIVQVAATPQPWGRYLEAAPANWNGTSSNSTVSWAQALSAAANYAGGGSSDWRLPTVAELGIYGMSTYYSGGAASYWPADSAGGPNKMVRPIRSFG